MLLVMVAAIAIVVVVIVIIVVMIPTVMTLMTFTAVPLVELDVAALQGARGEVWRSRVDSRPRARRLSGASPRS